MPPVEIQWCDHSSVLLEYLRQLYEEGRFVDVGLECEGRQVKAHKAVISACSPYLEVSLDCGNEKGEWIFESFFLLGGGV